MTDLHELKQDIDELRFPTPPVGDIIERARRHRRRGKRRVGISVGLVALVMAVTIVVVVGSAGPKGPRAEAEFYQGTATAGFVSPNGLLYVADQGNNSLLALGPAGRPAFAVLSRVPLPFTPGVVAVSPDGTMAYVSPLVPEFEGGSDTLYEVDLTTRRIVRTIVDRTQPLGSITLAPNGTTAYAWGDDIVPIDLRTGHIGAPIAQADEPYTDFEIAPDGKTAVATTEGPRPGYQEIDLADGKVIRTVTTASVRLRALPGRWTPEAVAFSPTGTTALLTVENETGDDSTVGLLQVSVKTGRIESGTDLGRGLAGNVVVAPDGDKAFVFVLAPGGGGASGAFTVVPVVLATDKALPTIVVGDGPGLGLLQWAGHPTMLAVDTGWRVTTVDENTDRIRSVATVAVPSLRGPSLQPVAFAG
jgi:DNA-binding beta-propeller fold protein YncE